MAYVPYLIGKYAQGLDHSVQPWLLPDDAQDSLYDGFVYRGEWCKRPGYSQFAVGQVSSASYTESRMVKAVSGASMTGAINSINKTYTITATTPLSRGGFTVVGNTPSQSLTDNGLGYFLFSTVNLSAITQASPVLVTTSTNHGYTTGDQVVITNAGGMTQINSPLAYTITVTGLATFTLNGVDSTLYSAFTSGGTVQKVAGTINYSTGAVSVTFATAPTAGTVVANYNYHPGLPVMMVANFYKATGVRELIVADTRNLNRYNPTTNRLEYISASAFTGDDTNFFSWVNYKAPDGTPRLLFTNNVDSIFQYDGTTVSAYPVYTTSTAVSESYGSGTGGSGPYTHSAASTPVVRRSVTVTAGAQSVTDDGLGAFTGDGTGTINYTTGAMSVTFSAVVGLGDPITVAYKALSAAITTALHLFTMKDRLVILRPTYSTGIKGQRILVSGTGYYCDTFTTDAPGAGFVDLSDPSWIYAAAFNRDDLIIFTQNSTWIQKYTGNDVVPFVFDKLDQSRGSGAPYSGITYLNQTTTLSQRGFIGTDGYKVERTDDKIPQFSFNDINQNRFQVCFVGTMDEDRDHYLLYPSPGQSVSNRILVTNYEEGNYQVYRLPLSCMGEFIEAIDYTWSDLSAFSTWDDMAARFGNWNAFSYMKGLPFAIGGGHGGEIWRLNVNGIEDNPTKIRAITVVDSNTLQITTDYQRWALGDYIYIDGISGMAEANNKQGAIKNVITPNYVFQIDLRTTRFSTYTSGGTASRVIPFESSTKKFNPFVQECKKVRCGYMYFYVTSSGVATTRNVNISGVSLANPCVITATNHQFQDGNLVAIYGVSGTVQLNGLQSRITVIDADSFSLDSINSSSFTAYTSGGVAAGPDKCFIDVEITTNDNLEKTQVEDSSLVTYGKPYRVDCTPDLHDGGSKKWVKIYPNQVGRFIQFTMKNTQAMSDIRIQAIMPGFDGVGRLI